jgi:hypothetical protein
MSRARAKGKARPLAPPKNRPAKIQPGVLWSMAARVYHDPTCRNERERWESWLHRASRTLAECGNFVHVPGMIDACNRLDIAPPEGLARVVQVVFEAAATGGLPDRQTIATALGQHGRSATARYGRHSSVVREAAEAVLTVETLLHYSRTKSHLHRLRDAGLMTPLDALAETEALFAAPLGPVGRGGFIRRSRETIDKQVHKARKLLRERDSHMRALVQANFPPSVLDELTRTE